MNKNLITYLKTLTILFAEDDETLRKNVIEYLKLIFKDILVAKNGEEAYDIYYEKRPDLILTDIDMPKLSGIDFLKQVREHDKKTPAIIMTAHTKTEYLIDAVELNITRYIVKPFVGDDFLAALEKMFESVDRDVKLDDEHTYIASKKVIQIPQKELKLTKKEHKLLELLIDNANQLTSYEAIEEHVWSDMDDVMTSETLRTLIKSLRKKLPKGCVENVSGSGYKLII